MEAEIAAITQAVLAFVLSVGGLTLVTIGPIGKAIAERIRGRGTAPMHDPELLAELDALRRDVSELQERADFTERLLAQERDARRVGPG